MEEDALKPLAARIEEESAVVIGAAEEITIRADTFEDARSAE